MNPHPNQFQIGPLPNAIHGNRTGPPGRPYDHANGVGHSLLLLIRGPSGLADGPPPLSADSATPRRVRCRRTMDATEATSQRGRILLPPWVSGYGTVRRPGAARPRSSPG